MLHLQSQHLGGAIVVLICVGGIHVCVFVGLWNVCYMALHFMGIKENNDV